MEGGRSGELILRTYIKNHIKSKLFNFGINDEWIGDLDTLFLFYKNLVNSQLRLLHF